MDQSRFSQLWYTQLTTLAVIAACCCLIPTDSAKGRDLKGVISVSMFGGVGFLLDDIMLTDLKLSREGIDDAGYDLGVTVEYGLSDRIAVVVEASYSRVGLDYDQSELASGDIRRGHWSITQPIGAYVKWHARPLTGVTPYLQGGVILGKPSRVHGESHGAERGEFELSPGMTVGGMAGIGVRSGLSRRVSCYLETSIRSLFTDGKDADLQVNGIPAGKAEFASNIQWLTTRVGFAYSFSP